MINVSLTKEWRDGVLCFIFKGATKGLVSKAFAGLKGVCRYEISTEMAGRTRNGHCMWNIVVKTTASSDALSVSEDELTTLVVHFLRKMNCEVTLFDDLQKFVNA